MGVLATLRDQGLRVGVEAGRLTVGPKAALTEAIRTTVRINKDAILRELGAEADGQSRAIIAARDASALHAIRHALVLCGFVVCGNCARFTFGADPAGQGDCFHYRVDAPPFIPGLCPAFEVSATPTAPSYLPDPDGARIWARECT